MTIKNKGAAIAFGGLIAIALFGVLFILEQRNNYEYHKPQSHPPSESIQDISAEIIAYYTKVLAWFTGLLAIVSIGQGIILIRADRTAKVTAEAALKSAIVAERSLFELERPWLFLRGVHIDYRIVNATNAWELKLHFANVGRSPAIIDACIFNVVSKSIAATIPDYAKCTDTVRCVKTLSSGDDFFADKIGLDSSCYLDIDLVLYGKLIYKELGGTEHVSAFGIIPVRIKVVGERAFDIYGGDAYNYYT